MEPRLNSGALCFWAFVGILRRLIAPPAYIGANGGCWRQCRPHATLLGMTMKDLASLVAVVVGMLLVLVTP